MKARYLVPFLFLGLAGCSSLGNKLGLSSSAPSLPSISQKFRPLILWKDNLGTMGDSVLVPAVDHGAIFAASGDGKLSRIEGLRGKEIWKIDTGSQLTAGVGIGDGLVMVGSKDGEVMAFDESGKQKWKFEIKGELLSPPQADDGIAVVRVGDGRIFGIDDETGKQKWVYQFNVPPLSVRNYAGVVVSQGSVYAGFAGGKLVSLDLKTGAVAWESTVALPHGTTELERIADVTSLPVVDELQVCAVAFQGKLSCFDIGKGELIWSRDIASHAGMTVSKRSFFVSDQQDDVLSLDSGSGIPAWKQIGLSGREITAPYAQDNYVVVGDRYGYVHFMSRADGELVARTDTDGSAIRAHPVYLNSDVFLVQTVKGHLYAMSAP
ncbi:MAG: outer membrane protein assembly factor BamB [Burkholderiales bacterium]|nr:outer membrane protein assembly factor BamB [Burkholderiales bacterium]